MRSTCDTLRWRSYRSTMGCETSNDNATKKLVMPVGFWMWICAIFPYIAPLIKRRLMNDATQAPPLSWDEARSLLRSLIENYLKSPPINRAKPLDERAGGNVSILTKGIQYDLDLHCGSLLLSMVMTVIAAFSFSNRMNYDDDEILAFKLRRSELIAASLFFAASLCGAWMVQRRRFLCLNDSDSAKRREIRKFLRLKIESNDVPSDSPEFVSNAKLRSNTTETEGGCTSASVYLTAQTEIFPVYRRTGDATSWTKIPSLLLVKGDWIALQIGDIAPAMCYTSIIDKDGTTRAIHLGAGERVTMETFGLTAEDVTMNLPRGRTALSATDDILTLCNNMQIFTMADTPLTISLNRVAAIPKSSQVSRQVQVIRETLLALSIAMFVVTGLIAIVRRDSMSEDNLSVVKLPILAALGVLPVAAPTFICLLEVLGTARILTTVHTLSRSGTDDYEMESPTKLFVSYSFATLLSRLSLWSTFDTLSRLLYFLTRRRVLRKTKLIRVPPASVHLLEKLGVVTAFALIDDELACEPQSIPQQLLIPSAKGLKLLDLCPVHDLGDGDDNDSDNGLLRKQKGRSFDSDSESEDGTHVNHRSNRPKVLTRRLRRNRSSQQDIFDGDSPGHEASRFEVQFEEPNWWQHIPSLKCIGLACLLLDEEQPTCEPSRGEEINTAESQHSSLSQDICMHAAHSSLAKLVCQERKSNQLRSLAECIGFSTTENAFGRRGDISTFTEHRRLHVVSNLLFKERLSLDAHERSSEQARWWGLLRPDVTSVIVQDSRTKAYQLLSIGDPRIVCNLCNEAWQGEISTILPLAASDRKTILETANNWKLADLDVTAFSFSPVPHILETRLTKIPGAHYKLLDNTAPSVSTWKEKEKGVFSEWSFIGNQIFLGVLGSLVVPKREIRKLLGILSDAGVRFVYFSPRNMRRQKELAIQLGIDVAWNCAISLRPLESGEDDPHRMVSNYADWDVNAKLPHGVNDVRIHLKEVDNVPLLVSLFTDTTKATTKDMVEIFQEYNDTVMAVGLSHLTHNELIFSSADVAVGIDILEESCEWENSNSSLIKGHVLPCELEFAQAISSHSCAFRLPGASSVSHISSIIDKGRSSLDAATAATLFYIHGCLSFSLYVLFSVCTSSTLIPFVPTLGSIFYLLIVLPCLGLAIAMGDGDKNAMKHVPPKNERVVAFGRTDMNKFHTFVFFKSLLPALLPQILHLIVFGELVVFYEQEFVDSNCSGARGWVDLVRCSNMKSFSGNAISVSGSLVFAQFVLCNLITSAGFVHRFVSIRKQNPWDRNFAWLCALGLTFALLVTWVSVAKEDMSLKVLPWYCVLLALATPAFCLFWVEVCKHNEIKHERRSEKLRRLQFETRLGAWSPR